MGGVKGHFYYGWLIVLTCLVGLLVVGGSGFYIFSVFFTRIMEEFHWSRAASAAGISIYWAASGLVGPFIGRLVDRYGPKRIMIIGTISTSISLLLLSKTNSLFSFYFFYGLLAVSHCAAASVPYGFLIARWFTKQRGKAMGIASTGISFGGVLLIPLSELLISEFGWRTSYIFIGILVSIILLPLVIFIVKTDPSEIGLRADGVSAPVAANPDTPNKPNKLSPEWTVRSASHTLAFWLMCMTLFCTYMAMFGVLTHQIAFTKDMGISTATAATAFSITAFVGILGKLALGFIADRFGVKQATIFTFALQIIGLIVLMFTRNIGILYIYIIIFGFSMGGATLRPLLPSWLFGMGSLGTLIGVTQLAQSVGSSLGPWFAGFIFDVTNSYHIAFITFTIACVLGLVAICLANPPGANVKK